MTQLARMVTHGDHRIIAYIKAYRATHQGETPDIAHRDGMFWVNDEGGYTPEDIEAMASGLLGLSVPVASTADSSQNSTPLRR